LRHSVVIMLAGAVAAIVVGIVDIVVVVPNDYRRYSGSRYRLWFSASVPPSAVYCTVLCLKHSAKFYQTLSSKLPS